ncbi:hypothetical protein WJX81_001672 [Elliptochloris bilobata]|uniref:Lycopene beta-cyclase n=1 Tax=Elliptochloris bilobata TaxID=381761 RepID=A0AAW1SED9_9CHLO
MEGLRRADKAWLELCNGPQREPPKVIHETSAPLPLCAKVYDAVILGGTLGIFHGAALALRGRRVAVVERGKLQGREQEWNISRSDMKVFVDMGLVSEAELEAAIVSEFNPVRMGFEGRVEVTTHDVLNCGVLPAMLIEAVKQRFLAAGGTLLEGLAFQEAAVHPEGVLVQLQPVRSGRVPTGAGGAGGEAAELQTVSDGGSSGETVALAAGVLVDAMGSFSPIARQARRGAKPDSVVLMVGCCASGLPPAPAADLLYAFTELDRARQLQYFFEAFPARDGLTTYMFAYTDPAPGRASLEEIFKDYLSLLPRYRGVDDLRGVELKRAFFGFVPNWYDSPLHPVTSRLMHVGDSAGNRSALSFAGFGAMARHLQRLTDGLECALDGGLVGRGALGLLQPRSPAISMTNAMQQTMGTRAHQDFDDDIIVDYLASSFSAMRDMGPAVYRPFMQDYLQWSLLARIVAKQIASSPGKLLRMTLFLRSPAAGAAFVGNFFGIMVYDALYRLAGLVGPAHHFLLKPFPALLFRWDCLVDAFKYGSANDYVVENVSSS